MRWRIYYADGSRFGSEDGAPSEAPPLAVICVVQTNPNTGERELVHRFDWYWWREDEQTWYGGELSGLLDQSMHLGARWPKHGRTIQTEEYERIISAALREW